MSNAVRTAVYIKPENVAKWEEIEHKSEWVNDMLSGEEPGFDKKVRKIVKEELDELARTGSY